jgi:hypothetical protein
MNETLDHQRIERLMGQILLPIRENYRAGPLGSDRVLEALNALAAAAALVILGASESDSGHDERPLDFFCEALDRHLKQGPPLRDNN